MEWWKVAQVGDDVVCILSTVDIVEGRVYTVKKIRPSMFGCVGIMFDVGLDGDYCPHCYFRPSKKQSTETGMKILRKAVDGVREEEPA